MRLFSSLLVAAGLAAASLQAQVNISSITTNTTDAANSTAGALTFQNTTSAVTSFNGGGTTYYARSIADSAYVRRNGGTPGANTSSAWYAQAGSVTNLQGTYATTYSSLLLGNNINRGSDNTFANGTAADAGNIERLDFVFTSGLTATSDLSFAIFERGASTVHDAFSIAVITGWSVSLNAPTSYATLKLVNAGWGTTDVATPFTYDLLRYNTNDNLSTPTSYNETGTQGVGGVYLTLSQLGISAGTKIYGYSLFGYDVPQNANLTQYASFPTNTNNSTGSGGIDLAAVNGVLFSSTPVPEPSTYALFGVGSLAGIAFLRRRRRAL